jgi:hypothetical protein
LPNVFAQRVGGELQARDDSLVTQPKATKSTDINLFVGLGLTALALALYLATVAPTVLPADAGEFQFALWLPGIVHPTGYPLYTLLGWLWSHLLGVGQIAWRINVFSAVSAAATVGVVYGVCLGLTRRVLPEAGDNARRLSATASAATFAVTTTFWSQAVIAEVYALHALFVAIILWLCLRDAPTQADLAPRSGRFWLPLAFFFGLSLTHHRTTLLLLPGILAFVALETSSLPRQRRSTLGYAKKALGVLAPVALPLLLYLVLPLIGRQTPYATLNLGPNQRLVLYENSWPGFWNHVMATVFVTEIRLTQVGPQLALTWELVRQQVGWVGAGLGLLGLGTLARDKKWSVLALTGLGFGGLVAFNVIYTIGDVFVLFIPAWLILCTWIGLGWLKLSLALTGPLVQGKGPVVRHPLSARLEGNLRQLVGTVSVSTLFLLPAVLLITRYSQVDQSHNTAASDTWQVFLTEPIPGEAILVSNDRNEIMPLWYYQYVEGQRPDLLGLFPLIVTGPDYANVGRVLDQALASGRPVYLIKPMPGLALKADLIEAGPFFRALPISAVPDQPLEVEFGDGLGLLGYGLSSASIQPGETFTLNLYWQPRQPLPVDYTTFVHVVDDAGRGIAQNDHRPGQFFYPTQLWQTGETLRDTHAVTLPKDISAGTYRLLVGVYYQPTPGTIEPLGEGRVIGTISVR